MTDTAKNYSHKSGVLLALAVLVSCNTQDENVGIDAAQHSAESEVSRSTQAPEGLALWPELTPLPLDPEIENFVSGLLAKMNIEEKVGQLIQGELRSVTPADVKKYHLGSVLNGGGSTPDNNKHASAGDWLTKADAYYQASMDTSDGGQAIPLIWGSDAVHGHSNVYGATIFPHNIGLGAANNPDLLRDIGRITAIEMLVTGLDWTFAPTLAVVRDDRWGRTYEGYSEDPRIVSAYAATIIEGLQGVYGSEEFLGEDKIFATAKHFLGDGGTAGGRDQGDNQDAEEDLVRHHNAGYPAAIQAGVRSVMASFSSWQGEKMHGNSYLLTEALRERMGFTGFVVGDWNGHGQVPGCSNASCAQSLLSGLDMYMVPEDFRELYDNTLAQVRDGTIPMGRLDAAVRRILRVKKEAGLFDKGLPSTRKYAGKDAFLAALEHREVGRSAVRQSLVLLKNNGQLLPLSPSSRVLVAGDGADDIGKQTGGWTLSWQGTGNTNTDFPNADSIYDGIRQVVSAANGSVELSVDGSYSERPDVAIVVFGENPYAEFQGDKNDMLYEADNGKDLALLRSLQSAGIPVVAVFISGRPLWVNHHINAADAFVAAWLPGSEGAGIADLLFTRADGSMPYDFTGRLSYSWPRLATQTALNVGDEGYDPLFAYGYGLGLGDSADLEVLPGDSGLDGNGRSASGVYFSQGRALVGFTVKIGNADTGFTEVAGLEEIGEDLSPSLFVADREIQGDASRLLWRPEMPGYFVLESDGEELDLERESNGNLSLALMFQVQEMPAQALELSMQDAEGNTGTMLVNPALEVSEDWVSYRFSLRCFASQGVNMQRLTIPARLYSQGELSLGLAQIRLATEAEGQAYCPE